MADILTVCFSYKHVANKLCIGRALPAVTAERKFAHNFLCNTEINKLKN